MAQQDKTDWYWNGVLAGAVNNLYYDLINVDVVHTPYSTTHRNSSFFLQTRPSYVISDKWLKEGYEKRDVVDVKYLWNKTCDKESWWVYALLVNKSKTKVKVAASKIVDWCVELFTDVTSEQDVYWCWDLRLFVTGYVRWRELTPRKVVILDGEDPNDCLNDNSIPETCEEGEEEEDEKCYDREYRKWTWVQINEYEWWTTHWYFTDIAVREWRWSFREMWACNDCDDCNCDCNGWWISVWDYILVYDSKNWDNDWFSWQVRMITWIEWDKIMVDAPWQWFKTLSSESEEKEVAWWNVSYKIFKDWWEIVWYSNWDKIYMINVWEDAGWENITTTPIYKQNGLMATSIISVADVADKMYILTDNWWIHYSNSIWHDKFFIEDDVFVGSDKLALAEYRDILIAFGDRRIAVWVPDDNKTFTTLYNQSATVWLWSRYSFAEYDWDLIFVSNDKRLLALGIATNSWKYMLQYEDVWDMINGKLSALTFWDEVFVWNDGNDLRIFIQTKSMPYYNEMGENDEYWQAYSTWLAIEKHEQNNSLTRIIKFDKQFKVWTEDWVQWILLNWIDWWVYFWQEWIYKRARTWRDEKITRSYPYKSYISAYLIENESDWVGWTSSWLANRAKLYNLAKLNRLITTLWPGIYSHNSKVKITSYIKWLWSVYEYPLNPDTEDDISWIWIVSNKYTWSELSPKEMEKLECMNSVLQDSQKAYQPKCVWKPNAKIQGSAQQSPWCDNFSELLTYDKWVCIDDSIYEIAPTMPMVTKIWENQDYATQIKLELIWREGDIITFGGWLWEMFIAPLFSTGPDWEYQLQPNTDC